MKHVLVVESEQTGKFIWEVPEDFAPYLFCPEEAIGALPTASMREMVRLGGQELQINVQKAIEIHLMLLMQGIILGAKLNRPETVLATLLASQKMHVRMMNQLNTDSGAHG